MKARIILGALALLIATTSFIAFKPKAPHKKLLGQWFEYIGPQSSGNFASLSDARTRANYQYLSNPYPTIGSGYLNAIYVQQSEIDNNGTLDPTDDMPMVDISTTDAYNVLGNAFNPSFGWSDLTFNTATVDADGQP